MYGEGASLADLAFDGQAATVPVDDVLDDGKPQPGAAERAAARRIDPVEALRQPGQMGPGDAFAAVGNGYRDHWRTPPPTASDRVIRTSVLSRVYLIALSIRFWKTWAS